MIFVSILPKKVSSLSTLLAAMCKTVLVTLWMTSFRNIGKAWWCLDGWGYLYMAFIE